MSGADRTQGPQAPGLAELFAAPAPADPAEADALLRCVPELAGLPELAACVTLAAPPSSWPPAPAELLAHADPALLARVRAALGDLHARADREGRGGLAFLTGALAHFLAPERALQPGEHPLIVALLLRAAARAQGPADRPAALAAIPAIMDRWGR